MRKLICLPFLILFAFMIDAKGQSKSILGLYFRTETHLTECDTVKIPEDWLIADSEEVKNFDGINWVVPKTGLYYVNGIFEPNKKLYYVRILLFKPFEQ